MKKRGISNIIVIILLILIALVAIVLFYNIFKKVVQEGSEVSEAKSELMTENIDIKKVVFDSTRTNVNVTITKGPGKIILKNITITDIMLYADIFSAVDLSGSMANCDTSHKFAQCWNNQTNCNLCYGNWAQKSGTCSAAICILSFNQTNCEGLFCKGKWTPSESCSNTYDWNLCSKNQTNCEGICAGVWNYIQKCSVESFKFCKNKTNCENFCGGTWSNDRLECLESTIDFCNNPNKCTTVCLGTWDTQYFCEEYNLNICNNPQNCSAMCMGTWQIKYNCWKKDSSGNPILYEYPTEYCTINKTNCIGSPCSGTWTPTGNYACNNPKDPAESNKTDCENRYNGVWTEKLNKLNESNSLFIDLLISSKPGNRIGLVPYSSSVKNYLYTPLSNDSNSLKGNISKWKVFSEEDTCICCAINKAITALNAESDSSKFRSIVLMSDGITNIKCSEQNTGNYTQDAIKTAKDAYEKYGIRVYTIGLGDDVDENTMKEIATSGGGTYFLAANVSKLSEVYNQIYQEIRENWEAVKNLDHLKVMFYNKTSSYEYRIYDNIEPLETRIYAILLAGNITNVEKIEIYPVKITSSGKQVIGPALDTWELKE